MGIYQLRNSVIMYSAMLALVEAVIAGVWLGFAGFVAVVGAWLISSLNVILLFQFGCRVLGQSPADAEKSVRKSFRVRFLWIGFLLVILYLALSSQLSALTVGMVFLIVYLSVIAIFGYLVSWQGRDSKI